MIAEEVMHDTFFKIWENRRQLDPAQSFRSYLFTITRNHILNLLARSAREAKIAQEILASFNEVAHNNTEDEVVYGNPELDSLKDPKFSVRNFGDFLLGRTRKYFNNSNDEVLVLFNGGQPV